MHKTRFTSVLKIFISIPRCFFSSLGAITNRQTKLQVGKWSDSL
jgi:hypothetical protein